MKAGQYLYYADLISKLETAKKDLDKDNETLEEAKKKVKDFIEDNTFEGDAATTVKMQMHSYLIIADAMIQANNLDIDDYQTLCHELNNARISLTFDDLIGDVIVEQMEKAKRMAEQDWDRAEELDRKQSATDNPLYDAWYQMQEIYYKKSAEDNEELYEEWKKRSDKYDEVESNTLNLFENGKQLRQKAENALNELGKNYNGKSFDVYDDFWEDDLFKLMKEKGYVGLGDNFLDVDGENGGNQMWFTDENIEDFLNTADLTEEERKFFEDHKDLNKALVNGCPVIALINMFYRMEGKTKVSKKDFMKRVYEFLDDHPNYKKIAKIRGTAGLTDEGALSNGYNIEDYLEDYMREHGHWSEVEMENINNGSLRYIEKELKKKRPVIMSTDTVNGIRWGEIDVFGEFKDKEKKWENDERHAMTITGIKSAYNYNTNTFAKYVEVSSWGEKYYIPYEDFEKNKNKIKIAVNK